MKKRVRDRSYGNFVRNTLQLLKTVGWQRRDLAMRARIPRANISNYLTGKTRPSLDSLDAIATAFGISTARLICGPGDQEWKPLSTDMTPSKALEIISQHIHEKKVPYIDLEQPNPRQEAASEKRV